MRKVVPGSRLRSWPGQTKTSAGWERRRNLQYGEGAQEQLSYPLKNECYSKYLAAEKQAPEQLEKVILGSASAMPGINSAVAGHREVLERV